MPKQLVRICPSDRFCRVQNLPTSSVKLIWPITKLYFRQILSTDFLDRFYQDVKTGPKSRPNHVLWNRNPGFLKSEIGPFSDFKRKSHLMDLKSAHSQESDFQESGEVDRFLKMGTHFQERSGSLENGICVTWSGFWLCPGYLWL